MGRVFRVLVWLVLGLAVSAAYAVVTPSVQYGTDGSNDRYPSAVAACTAAADKYVGVTNGNGTVKSYTNVTAATNPDWCRADLTYQYGASTYVATQSVYTSWYTDGTACPANSTASGGACSCNSGYIESGNTCVPEPDECQKLAGQTAGYKNYEGKADEFFFCDGWNSAGGGKCVVKVERGLSWEDPPGSGHWFSQGKGVYTGQKGTSCNGSGGNGDGPAGSTPKPSDGKEPDKPDPGTAAPAPCPQGQSAGEVNGQRVCAPRGTDSPVEVKSTSSSTNANGDKTDTTKETKCDGAKCTTTTTDCTTLNGQSSSTCSSTSSTVSAGDACKGNSSLSVCGDGEDGSSFSGSCASGFQCKGDAIQCAMAQEQYKQRCDFVNWSSTWKQTGETPVTGVRQGFEQAAGGSQFTAWLNQPSETAACPAGKPMQLLGQTYVLSFDPLCEVGEGARPIVLAVAVLLALRTFMRVVLVG